MPFLARGSDVKDDDRNTSSAGNDGSQEEKQDPQQLRPVGFWDPSLKHVRKEAVLKWLLTTLTLMIAILGILSLYWAVLFQVPKHLANLVIYIVDFDAQAAPYNTTGVNPIVGPALVRLGQQKVAQKTHLAYISLPPSQFDYDPIQVRQAVYDFHAWAAIIINPNATALLQAAVTSGNSSYDPMGACQLVFIDSRDDTTWYDYLFPLLSAFMTEATSTVGEMWSRQVLQNATTDATLRSNIALAPQAVSPAIGFSMYNLRPFYPYVATPAVSIGLIYLIIISFFSFSFYLPIHMKYLKPEGHPPLHFYQLVIWRWLATMTAYVFMSLAYSLISLAFLINFSGRSPVTSETEVTPIEYGNPNAYGKGSFPVYWAINFLGMGALGLACENVTMVVGQPWTALWLIFWVISNVATSFYDIDLAPQFFRWGYAWPLHNIVEASRQILFDLHSRIGLNFGVLVAWVAVNTVLFPFACYFMKYKSKRGIHEYWT